MNSPTIRVPLRLVKERYGSPSETDTAGDVVIECVNLVSEYPGQFRVTFGYDASHENPWYHALTCELQGMSSELVERVLELLAHKGLVESTRRE